jgi:hypothetical protein
MSHHYDRVPKYPEWDATPHPLAFCSLMGSRGITQRLRPPVTVVQSQLLRAVAGSRVEREMLQSMTRESEWWEHQRPCSSFRGSISNRGISPYLQEIPRYARNDGWAALGMTEGARDLTVN